MIIPDIAMPRPSSLLAASDIAVTPNDCYLFVGSRDLGEFFLDGIHRYRVHDNNHFTHLGKIDADAILPGLASANEAQRNLRPS